MKRRRSAPPKDKTVKAAGNQTLRIIGGQWRGRKLSFASVDGLRPTGDRIRETLFNWIMTDLPSAHCLDAFSGSGALGLEALSRGAASAVLIEQDRNAAHQIRENLQLLNCNRAQVEQTSCLTWLAQQPSKPFDVVFLDPPFQQHLWADTIALLEQPGWLSDGAAIYVETPRSLPLSTPADWQLHREKHAGDVSYRLYYRQ
ncbi:MAG: 16S rRNA (guanine(966)-N(2))-methyltransferase RsmD [Cellvibrionaceae bacterium]